MDIEVLRLKEIIEGAIAPTISLYRKHSVLFTTVNYDKDSRIRKTEIEDFLLSIPYFDRAFSYYLINDGKIGNMQTKPWINNEWLYSFNRMVNLWAGSNSWLHGPLARIHVPGYGGEKKILSDRILLPQLIGKILAC